MSRIVKRPKTKKEILFEEIDKERSLEAQRRKESFAYQGIN